MTTVSDEVVLRNLTYVVVGSLGVIIWDVLVNIGTDYTRIRKNGFSLVKFIYLLSRLSTLVLLFCETILQTAPVSSDQCVILNRITTSLFTVYASTTHLILFFRLRAVYTDAPVVVGVFFIFWIIVAGTSVLCPFAVSAGSFQLPFQPFKTCVQINVKMAFAQIILIAGTVYANCVSLTISWRLLSYFALPSTDSDGALGMTGPRNNRQIIRSFSLSNAFTFISGERLPMFSRALFRDGQLHYLVMNSTNIASLIGISMKSIPLMYRFSLVFPLIVVNNSMVCYVFRNVGTSRYYRMKESLPVFGNPQSLKGDGAETNLNALPNGLDDSRVPTDRRMEHTEIGIAL